MSARITGAKIEPGRRHENLKNRNPYEEAGERGGNGHQLGVIVGDRMDGHSPEMKGRGLFEKAIQAGR